MKRVISAADDKQAELFDDKLDKLSDDISYVMEGFETIARQGNLGEATQLIDKFNESVQSAMRSIADKLA